MNRLLSILRKADGTVAEIGEMDSYHIYGIDFKFEDTEENGVICEAKITLRFPAEQISIFVDEVSGKPDYKWD